MAFDSHQLDVIEEKLLIGFPLSTKEDVKPVKNLVASFRKIWRLYNEYPEFGSKVDETLFRTVFDDMSSRFCRSNSSVSLKDDCGDSESPSNVNRTDLEKAPGDGDVGHSNSSVPVDDNSRDSESLSNVGSTNSEMASNGVSYFGSSVFVKDDSVDTESPINVNSTDSEKASGDVDLSNSSVSVKNDSSDSESPAHVDSANSETASGNVRSSNSNSASITSTSSTIPEVYLECTECDNEFLLLNNDPLYAYQMHLQTPQHIEVMDSLRHLHSSFISNATSTSNVPDNVVPTTSSAAILNGIDTRNFSSPFPTIIKHEDIIFMGGHTQVVDSFRSTSKVRQRGRPNEKHARKEEKTSKSVAIRDECREDKWIRKKGEWRCCILCDVNLPHDSQLRAHVNGQMHKQDSPWVQMLVGDKYSCTLCDARAMSLDKLHEHLDGRRHIKNLEDREERNKPSTKPSLSSNLLNIRVTSPMNIYRTNCESRMAYFLNKTCFIRNTLIEEFFDCWLCNIACIEFENHMLHTTHRGRVAEVIKKSDSKTASFEVAILTDRRKKGRRCHLCNVNLPENNPYSHFTHVNSAFHKQQVQRYFQCPRFKDWERGIILREGKPYCFFCELILDTERSMLEHVDDPAHISLIVKGC